MINTVTLEGKVVSEIIVRKSTKGTSVTDFRLIHKAYKSKNPVFIDIEVWGDQADRLSSSAKRGSHIIVYGEIRRDVWTKDGVEKSKLKLTANKVVVSAEFSPRSDEEPAKF